MTGLIAGILLILPLALMGCASVTLHPIAKQDIVEMKPSVSYTPDRHGYFLSDMFIKSVMKAKVDKVNLGGV